MTPLARDGLQRKTCRCGDEVLAVHLDDEWVTLDVREVEPEQPCGNCRAALARARKPPPCWQCNGRRTLGEPWPEQGVAISGVDTIRWFKGDRGKRKTGEAVHRLHVCAVTLSGTIVKERAA